MSNYVWMVAVPGTLLCSWVASTRLPWVIGITGFYAAPHAPKRDY